MGGRDIDLFLRSDGPTWEQIHHEKQDWARRTRFVVLLLFVLILKRHVWSSFTTCWWSSPKDSRLLFPRFEALTEFQVPVQFQVEEEVSISQTENWSEAKLRQLASSGLMRDGLWHTNKTLNVIIKMWSGNESNLFKPLTCFCAHTIYWWGSLRQDTSHSGTTICCPPLTFASAFLKGTL